MADSSQTRWWRETGLLAGATLGVAVIVALFFLTLSTPPAEGYPTGFVLAASGLPIVLVLIVFWFARRQESVDRRNGLYED